MLDTCGALQGSVLGTLLRKIVYDGVLRIPRQFGVKVPAFAVVAIMEDLLGNIGNQTMIDINA